ncbi:MAG: hypothetical protein AAF657_22595 [Acidobacteriota bacterium]
MEFTVLFAKIVGPVLLVRALSIVLDRKHFLEMIDGVEREISTVSFSFFPIALFMTCTAIAVTHSDTSSLAAILIHLIAWGGLAKATALILFPHILVAKGKLFAKAVFLNVVLVACFAVGGYFTWFGYFAPGNG